MPKIEDAPFLLNLPCAEEERDHMYFQNLRNIGLNRLSISVFNSTPDLTRSSIIELDRDSIRKLRDHLNKWLEFPDVEGTEGA